MSQHIDPTESLPTGVAGRINPVCDRFEKAWQTGGRPRLEEFLPQAEAADQPWLLRALLRLEVDYRGRSGEKPIGRGVPPPPARTRRLDRRRLPLGEPAGGAVVGRRRLGVATPHPTADAAAAAVRARL